MAKSGVNRLKQSKKAAKLKEDKQEKSKPLEVSKPKKQPTKNK